MFKKIAIKLLPYFILFLLISPFFTRLYFPPSIFVTPDFGRSDLLHLNLPTKYILSENLKAFKLPLWDNRISQGYPAFSVGTTGVFYLPDLVTFLLLPYNLAIPTVYLITFLIAGFSMYFLLRLLNLNAYSSIFGAISFTFSAAMIIKISHISVMQTVSFLPLIFSSLLAFTNKPTLKLAIVSSFLISQFFLIGFTQVFIYANFLFAILFILYRKLCFKKDFSKYLISYILIIFLALTLSAVQLIPTIELTRLSVRESGVDPAIILNGFPLFPRNLLTYFNPFILGNASNGTYNSTNWNQSGVYWENTSYIGLTALALSLMAIVYLVIKRPKNIYLIVALITIFSILLSLGKFSPFHILFSIPPFSFFRVPARFSIFTQFFAVILAAHLLDKLSQRTSTQLKKILLALIIGTALIDFYSSWWNYHPIGKTSEWLAKPQTLTALNPNYGDYRIVSFSNITNWNDIFVNKGWNGQEDNYRYFLNALDENFNVFFNLNQLNGYLVLPTRRYQFQGNLIRQNIKTTKSSIEINTAAKKLMDTAGVRYIVSTSPVINSDYSNVFETENGHYKYFVYESNKYLPKFSLFYAYKKIDTIEEYQESLEKEDLSKVAISEKILDLTGDEGKGSIEVNQNSEKYYNLSVNTDKKGLLIISQSYYPGWEAKVDSKETSIFPININSQGILVPEGSHTVTLDFNPKSVKIGALISLLSYLFLFLLLISNKKLKFFQ